MSQASFATKLIPGPLREALLLERALQATEGRSAEQTAKLRELAAAIDTRLAAAESLAAGDQLAPALIILRDAAFLAARAVLIDRGGDASTAQPEENLKRVRELVDSGQLSGAPEGLPRAFELVSKPNSLAYDDLPTSEGMPRRLEVETTVNWLRSRFEPRTASQIKRSRVLRLAVVALAVVGVLVGLVVWGANKVLSPKNLAYGKLVQLSSRRPHCGTPGPEGLPPSGLVDGSKSGSYDICTNSEVNPWAIVDLGRPYSLTKAKVYNRDDCCWGQYDLPQVFEVSLDGQNYTEVARQTTSYTAAQPWTVNIDGRQARYVRLRVDSRDPRELVLTELEVFGR